MKNLIYNLQQFDASKAEICLMRKQTLRKLRVTVIRVSKAQSA